ncbi:MAG: hypothetical protein NTW03_05520, partial [Verrucomicrobia bacterium]|nr:hypothetical protein [Verrucomicrobiota bacterium]
MTLFTGMLTYNVPYTLTVNGVSDRATTRNIIAPNSQISFTLADFVLTNIGSAAISGTLSPVAGGFDLTAAGKGTAGTSDQFMFWAQTRSGDFDVMVRIPAINPVNPFTRAG